MTRQIVRAADVLSSFPDEWLPIAHDSRRIAPALVTLEHDAPLAIGVLTRNPLHPRPVHFLWRIGDDTRSCALVGSRDALCHGHSGDRESDAST